MRTETVIRKSGLDSRSRERRLTLPEKSMSNAAVAQAQAKKFANQNQQLSEAQEIRENIEDLAGSVGDMAAGQYERAQDTATDMLQDASSSIRRNPLTAIGIGVGVGFLVGLMTGGRGKPASRTPS
jgi:ElaB/YqjD/DUF883 family membrane-anchored ribosome-binding protein